MRKRLLWIGGLGLGLVVLALVVVVVRDRSLKPGVTVENFKRLHKGMSVKEAEAILGRLPDRTLEPSHLQAPTVFWWEEGFAMFLQINDKAGIGTTPTVLEGRLHFFDGKTLDVNVQEDPGESALDQFRRLLGLK